MRRRVLVIETGGTIGSQVAADGELSAALGLGALVEAQSIGLNVDLCVRPWSDPSGLPLAARDSCDIGPPQWTMLADQVCRSNADAVVILHGTDTMAWTASALSFGLPPGHIPVVMTGAMRPAGALRSDARRNIRLALAAAADRVCPLQGEVVIAFAGALSRGVRSTKVNSRALDAFSSPSLPKLRPSRPRALATDLATWRSTAPDSARSGGAVFNPSVLRVPMAPGLVKATLRALTEAISPAGVLFELYGVGTAPDTAEIGQIADELAERGIVSVATSSCSQAGLDLTLYAASRPIRESQLVAAGAMTAESAMVKLMWACGGLQSAAERRAMLLENVCGER